MQNFHYNYIKNQYGGKAEILVTDIGSFMYKLNAENWQEDFCKDKSYLNSVVTEKVQIITIMQIT